MQDMEEVLSSLLGQQGAPNITPWYMAALRDQVQSVDPNVVDEGGNTLLHRMAEYKGLPTPVYMLVEHGVPINRKNKEGETCLHVAVRAGNRLMVETLLQCGADANITNKLGTSPANLGSSDLMPIFLRFRPGLYQAVCKGDFGAVCRLLKNWVSVTSKSLDDSRAGSMLELARSKKYTNVYVLKCLQKIKDSQTQSILIHSVLADDVDKARAVLATKKMRTADCRYKREMNLLSVAIENQNSEMVKLLLEHGVRTNCRVQHRLSQVVGDSVPCPLLAYSSNPDIRVAQLLWNYGIHALHERDKEGNTSLIRAVIHNASLQFVQWYVSGTEGQTLARRNIEGLTAYEVAKRSGRTDLTSYINQYIDDDFERLGADLAAQFYGCIHPKLSRFSVKVEADAAELFQATLNGDVGTVIKCNNMNYQDRNGQTALHKAVAAAHVNVIKEIGQSRPVLKGISDNYGRYPLHLAFLLPENDMRGQILSILLQNNAEHYEFAPDKDGLNPADYLKLDGDTKMVILQRASAGT